MDCLRGEEKAGHIDAGVPECALWYVWAGPVRCCIVTLIILPVLASGRKRKRVPFLTLEENASLFIEEEYLPASFAMKDPHNLRKEAMEAFFDLVQKRQMERGESDSFRFHAYEVEKGELVPAEYPETEQSISQMAGKRKQRGNVTEGREQHRGKGKCAKHGGRQRQAGAPSTEGESSGGGDTFVPFEDSMAGQTLAVQEVADQSSVSHGGVGQGGEGRHSRRGPESNLSPDIEAFSGEEDGPGAATFMPDGLGTASTDIEAGLSTVPHQDLVVVNHDIACQLQRIGVSVGEPINGPMEGDPQYAVPQSILGTSPAQRPQDQQTTIPVDPILGQPDFNQHRCQTNDQLAQDEAQAVVGRLKSC